MDSVGVAQILKRLEQQRSQQQSQQTQLKQNQLLLQKLKQNKEINGEEYKIMGANTYQSVVNGDFIIYDGKQVIGRKSEQLNISCNFDFRHAPYIFVNGEYKIVSESQNYIDLVNKKIFMNNINIQCQNLYLKGSNSNINILDSSNIHINNCSNIQINTSDEIVIDDSENIIVGYDCSNISIGKDSGKVNGRISFDSECQNIKLGKKSAYAGGQIIFGNRCGYQSPNGIIFDDECASYGGFIQLEKQCGSFNGKIRFGKGCAAGCDLDFMIPEIDPFAEVIIPQIPQGSFGGGKIQLGVGCASGPGGQGTIILEDYCAYNVGSIVFGDRCASSLRTETSLGGTIHIGTLSAYAGTIRFGQKCSYDCILSQPASSITLGPYNAYSGEMIFGDGCCYYGGNITTGVMCAINGKILFNDSVGGINGAVSLGKACGAYGGVISLGQASGYEGGHIIMDDYSGLQGQINLGMFSAYESRIVLGKWCGVAGQILVGFGCQNITFGDDCAKYGRIAVYENCSQIEFGNGCAENNGRIVFESSNGVNGSIVIGSNCAKDNGHIQFGTGCAESGSIFIDNDCARDYGQIIIGNQVSCRGGQLNIGQNCCTNIGKINIGSGCAFGYGKINIGPGCSRQNGNILIANKSAINYGSITIGSDCSVTGGIEIGYHCATGHDFVDNEFPDKIPGMIEIKDRCAQSSGRIIISMENCSSYDGNGGVIVIDSDSAQNNGRIVIEAFCTGDGHYDGINDGNYDKLFYITGIIQIGHQCANNGTIAIMSRNARNGFIDIKENCATNKGRITINSSSVINEAQLIILPFIATNTLCSNIQIFQLRDQRKLTLGSSDQQINGMLWKLNYVCTKDDDSDVDEYRIWNFYSIQEVPSNKIQKMVIKMNSQFRGYYIDDVDNSLKYFQF